MLFAKPTKIGTGAEFWGDYNDLFSLYNTFIKLSSDYQTDEGSCARNEYLLTLIRSDINNAYRGNKLIDSRIENGFHQYTTYYGFRADWITILYTLSSLRYNAGYIAINEEDLCNLNMFEYCTRKALRLYDDKGAKFIELFINKRIDITSKYTYIIYQHILCQYLNTKPSKTRFRGIPQLLITSNDNNSLRKIITKAEIDANIEKCSINDFYFDYDDDTIIW